MFGFYSTQKGVQNLLEMNLQIYFIKEKEILYFFFFLPGFGPLAQPARWPKRALPSFSFGLTRDSRAPLSLGRPAGRAQRAPPLALAR
jgi:hypothetical protein